MRRPLHGFFVAGMAALVALLPAQPGRAEERAAPGLFVQAWVSTAGPYGESWNLTIAPDGEVNLQVLYLGSPSGTLLARFTWSAAQLNAIREAVHTADFFALPARLAPPESLFHQPHLRLEIHFGERHQNVTLYDPDALAGQPEAARFLTLWRRVFEELPFKPSW